MKEVNQTLSRERVKIQHQRETDEREKALERSQHEKYRKDVSEVIHKVKSRGVLNRLFHCKIKSEIDKISYTYTGHSKKLQTHLHTFMFYILVYIII